MKLSHEITHAEWIEDSAQWQLSITETLPSGDKKQLTDKVDFLIGNIGVLNTWKWPEIPNRQQFKGKITHSASYDTDIDCTGKRVCVIGSGASSLQIIPVVQKQASHLVSFYRTAQWVSSGLGIDGWTDAAGGNFACTFLLSRAHWNEIDV